MNAPLPQLNGPRLEPASGGPAKQLVVFLHGYGADGNDLIALGQHWRHLLPGVAFLSPHAPEFCGGNPFFGGRQWFDLTPNDLDALWSGTSDADMAAPHMDTPTSGADNMALPPFSDSLRRGVSNAAAALNAFLDSQLAALGLDDSALALVGFSQGTMLALHVALRRPKAVAALVGFSGLLIEPGRLASELVSRPPVLLVHGDADDVLPVRCIHDARAALAGAGLAVEWHVRPGLGHGIDAEGLELGGRFLVNAFSRS